MFSHVKFSGPYQTTTEHNPCTPVRGGGGELVATVTVDVESFVF
jgi:hypothetical protein